MTTSSNTNISTGNTIPDYTTEELKAALLSLTLSSSTTTITTTDTNNTSLSESSYSSHIYGYDVTTGSFHVNHTLSMLQIITAHRILDYQNQVHSNNTVGGGASMDEKSLLHQMNEFRQIHGPVLNVLHVIQEQYPAMALAAEFKRASPSKGILAPSSIQIEDQVQLYTDAGACMISVLTEPYWFHGSLLDLTKTRIHTCSNNNNTTIRKKTRPAILRKDFIISKEMILEAAASGADTILLIVAITPYHVLREWIYYSRTVCQMEPLVEVHTMEELYVALQADAKVIGVNNRNLHTFQLDLRTTDRIAIAMKENQCHFDLRDNYGTTTNIDYALCALSGMSTAEDVNRYRQQGISMCLIGESLMRASDPKAAIISLCLHPQDYHHLQQQQQMQNHSSLASYIGGTRIIKVCGITNPDDALWACQCGVNLIGIIFVPQSKRCVMDLQVAKDIVHVVQTFGERNQRVEFSSSSNHDGVSSPIEIIRRNTKALEDVACKRPLVVGVFQNQDESYIRHIVQECGFDLIQFHGQEGMEVCSRQRCIVPAIRVVDIEASEDPKQLDRDCIVNHIIQSITSDPFLILLDTSIKGSQGGGTGMTFDWSIAEAVQNRGLPILIAGGLTPDNISEAVKTIRPWGVDVSSGVELCPGKKDADSVQSFIANARKTALEASQGF